MVTRKRQMPHTCCKKRIFFAVDPSLLIEPLLGLAKAAMRIGWPIEFQYRKRLFPLIGAR